MQKRNLRHKIEPIVRLAIQTIQKPSMSPDLTTRVLRIFAKLGELLDSNVHLIIPFLCAFIKKDQAIVSIPLKIEITKLFSCLAHSCSSTVQFLSLILDAILHNMNSCSNSSKKDAKETSKSSESSSSSNISSGFLNFFGDSSKSQS